MTPNEIEASGDWIEAHQRAWGEKPALREFYETQYFRRILSMMPPGRSLEIGAGPGFFSAHHRCDVVSDVTDAPTSIASSTLTTCHSKHLVSFWSSALTCCIT